MRRLRNTAALLSNRGIELEAAGELEAAASHHRDALVLDPQLAEAWSNLGNVLRAKGERSEAIACYNRALELKPDYPDAHSNLAAALLDLEQWELAKQHLEKALAITGDHPQALNNMGNVHMGQGDPNTACYLYEQAIAADPMYASAHNNLGNALKELGDLDGARDEYDRAILLKPDYAEAHYNRADLPDVKPDLATLGRLTGTNSANSIYATFAFANALDRSGDYKHAWQYYQAGNALKREEVVYNEPGALDLIERVKRVFTPELFEGCKGSGDPSRRPIFIVGFPRCGSTLVEQILSSHPEIHAGGELTLLEQSTSNGFPESIAAADSGYLSELEGHLYLDQLPATPKPFVTDKLLGNFMRVGLIKLILPNARIIHVRRNPLDSCLSAYQHLFTRGVLFSYELGELGRYYRAYRSLMEHWDRILPYHVYRLDYEQLVADPETEVGALIAYLGLDSDSRCLEWWKNPRPVRTASVVQVRQPLFNTSVDKWKKYEFGLDPLKEALQI